MLNAKLAVLFSAILFLFSLTRCGKEGAQAPTTATTPVTTGEGAETAQAPVFSQPLVTADIEPTREEKACLNALFGKLRTELANGAFDGLHTTPDGFTIFNNSKLFHFPVAARCKLKAIYVNKIDTSIGEGFAPGDLDKFPSVDQYRVSKSQLQPLPEKCSPAISALVRFDKEFLGQKELRPIEFGIDADLPSLINPLGPSQRISCGTFKVTLCFDCLDPSLAAVIQSPLILFASFAAAQGFLGLHTPQGNFKTEGIITAAQPLANGMVLTFAPGVIISSLFFKFLKGDALKFVTSAPFSQHLSQQPAPDGTTANVIVDKKADGSTEVTFKATRSPTSDVDRMAIIGFGSDSVGNFVTGAGIGLPL